MCGRDLSMLSRPASARQPIPRPVNASGPVTGHSTIIEAEMERAALAHDQDCVCPEYIDVELLPWSTVIEAKATDDDYNTVPPVRPREPRLNPDFLRILVLETNMRRSGKIGPGIGRARMILSPRCQEYRSSQLREQLQVPVDSC